MIPLAGMIFASSMNAVSVAAERLHMEIDHGSPPTIARNQAFKAGLIPIFNSLLAVGLVSLPGMMTGQILSGVSPLIAVRYQIVVMCMITGASGMSAALYLYLQGKKQHAVSSS
jgi:putative ABC transport system permease protein